MCSGVPLVALAMKSGPSVRGPRNPHLAASVSEQNTRTARTLPPLTLTKKDESEEVPDPLFDSKGMTATPPLTPITSLLLSHLTHHRLVSGGGLSLALCVV